MPTTGSQDDSPWQPKVSVVIPVLNEERHIEECLRSVAEQDYPGLMEVLVADGGSADRTRALVEAWGVSDPRFRLLDNPGRNQAAGLNLAIRESTGEIVARLDGHASWRPWHLTRCVELLKDWQADNVGGTMDNRGETVLGRAVARAARSPFGVGGARYRYGTVPCETDTVFLGCFRRSALDRVGPFDEAAVPHEDYELNSRIRESGGRIVFSPEIPTTYHTRASWRSLTKQYFNYGRAKACVGRQRPSVLRPYHFVPPAALAVSTTVAGLALAGRARRVFGLGLLGYGAATAVASFYAGAGESVGVRILIPAVFPVLHGAWGAGFWAGVVGRTSSSPGVRLGPPQ